MDKLNGLNLKTMIRNDNNYTSGDGINSSRKTQERNKRENKEIQSSMTIIPQMRVHMFTRFKNDTERP